MAQICKKKSKITQQATLFVPVRDPIQTRALCTISNVRNVRITAKLSQNVNCFLELAIRRETRAERTRSEEGGDSLVQQTMEQSPQ